MKLGSIRTFAEILKSDSAISNLLFSLHCPFQNFFLFFDANYLDRQKTERAHGKRKVAQLKRHHFLALDSQSINLTQKLFRIIKNFEVGTYTVFISNDETRF